MKTKIISTLVIVLILSMSFKVMAQTKIIGGSNTNKEDYPWMAALLFNEDFPPSALFFCGGSLIKDDYILTAAHCLTDDRAAPVDSITTANEIKIGFNIYSLSNPNSNYFTTEVESIILHPDYDPTSTTNDLALIKLKSPVALPIVKLPMQDDESSITADSIVKVMGWGVADTIKLENSDLLQVVDVKIISNELCNIESSYNGMITEQMLCAGFMEGGKDACQGDSGGPMVSIKENDTTQVGIVSWGYGCAQKNFPGVYTRTSKYINWINSNISVISSTENLAYTNTHSLTYAEDHIVLKGLSGINNTIIITDALGRIVLSEKLNNYKEEFSIPIYNLRTGLYSVSLNSENEVYQNRFFKQ